MNAIKRVVGKFILGIGMCVFAGSAMALDLGGMMQQLDQAAKQMDHQAAQQPNQQQAVQQQSSAPSFNCAKASTATEHLICSNSDLSALDVKLSQLYQQVMSKSNDVDSLKKSQNEWRKTKRDTCSDVNCLASTYNERINELSQMLSSSNAPTQLPSNSTDAIQKQAIQQQEAPQPQSIQPEANPNQLVADETAKNEAAKEVLKTEIAADLARIAANEKAEAVKAPIATEQNNTSQVTTPIFLSKIVGWLVNHILVVCALLGLLAIMMVMHSIKVVKEKSGIVFVDGTDGIITFGLAFIPIVFAAIAMYITDTEFTGTNFGNYYLLFLIILGVIISARTIAQNIHNPITLVSILCTKLLMITLFVFALIIAIVILVAGSKNRKQGDKETTGEYLERQREERNIEIASKVAAGATAAGAFFGAAKAIDKLTTFKGEYSFSLKSIVRWFSECFKLKETIINSRSADENNDVDVLYNRAISLNEKGDHGKAYNCFKKAALKGHAPSQYIVGESACRDEIASPDKSNVSNMYKSGLAWITKAADQGHSEAQNLLGMHYMYASISHANTDQEGDKENAKKWFNLAAAQGNADAKEWLVTIDED